ncbi:hypothetical protein DB346_18510 [Verrucomicrobia bacterium LW23]|nr:hypothetical protein DB346_18510 [Verrucomicrobia bacterium LW23]
MNSICYLLQLVVSAQLAAILLMAAAILAPLGIIDVRAGESAQAAAPASSASEARRLERLVDTHAIHVETAKPGVRMSGYVQASYTQQFASEGEESLGTTENAFRNDFDTNDFNINAIKLVIERPLGEDRTVWDAGFHTDIWFGEDASMFSAADPAVTPGGDLFLHQAYVNLLVPVGRGVEVRMGKMVSLLGYEGEERPDNMNYSYGLLNVLFYNGISTGLLGRYRFTESFEITLGTFNSWESSDGGIFAPGLPSNPGVTGQALLCTKDGETSLAWNFAWAPDGGPVAASPAFRENASTLVVEMCGEWKPQCVPDKRLTLAFDLGAGYADSGTDSLLGAAAQDSSSWWGVALFARYDLTPRLSVRTRCEYAHSDDGGKFIGAAVPGNNADLPTGSIDLWSGTVTGAYNLYDNVLLRVEYRCDHSQDDAINGGNQHQVSVDLTYAF